MNLFTFLGLKDGDTVRRSLFACVVLFPLSVFCLPCVFAAPTGGQVVAGSASIVHNGTLSTVNQTSQKAVINWQSFSIAAHETLNFVQPGRDSIALNRILGQDASQILGSLSANGQVFILNPNGVLFGKGAQVNVGGLVASTLNLTNEDFMAGRYAFSGTNSGQAENQGNIAVPHGGYVALIAPRVVNGGAIVAPNGRVELAAGEKISLVIEGGTLAHLSIDQGAFKAQIDNGGIIQATGGKVHLTAQAYDQLTQAVINHTGVIEATTSALNEKGEIVLLADMKSGTTKVVGTLNASAPHAGTDGGFIETSGAQVSIADGATVSAGRGGAWLIDPVDITIDSAAASTIVGSLNSGTNVSHNTSGGGSDPGNITVASALAWSGSGVLSLTANNNIAISQAITATNGGLTLNAGGNISAPAAVKVGAFTLAAGNWTQNAAGLPAFSASDFRISGGRFLRALGGDGTSASPYQLADVYGLQGMGSSGLLGKNFQLAKDIDATGTSTWNGGAGFAPVGGDFSSRFTGNFDGRGHVISGLTIDRPGNDSIGLFGIAENAVIQNVALAGGSVNGANYVGGLAGNQNGGSIANSHTSLSVAGVGAPVGGLVGFQTGSIDSSYATGNVTGGSNVGGLVGYQASGSAIANSYATGSVTGAGSSVGGLVGWQSSGGAIANSYATGSVAGAASSVGGLVGGEKGNITTSYATGKVQGGSNVGGLVGAQISGSLSSSYWDKDSTGQNIPCGNVVCGGATAVRSDGTAPSAFSPGSYGGFDFANAWFIVPGMSRPLLRAVGAVKDANGVYHIGNLYQLQSMAADLTGRYVLDKNIDAAATADSVAAGNLAVPNRSDVWGGAGFAPVGSSTVKFTGRFDGQGYAVSELTISRPASDSVGLFGYTDSAILSNVGLAGGSTSGKLQVGALVGWQNLGSINNSHATGNVTGNQYVGGLVGKQYGDIANSYATGRVEALLYVGGLVGRQYDNTTISNSYATGSVWGNVSSFYNSVGGLVGVQGGGILNSYATGNVTGGNMVGGLVGQEYAGGSAGIVNSYATGNVSGLRDVGGLVGYQWLGGIGNSHAAGNVIGTLNIGGLVGEQRNDVSATISNSYASGNVTGPNQLGGLVGLQNGSSITASYATGTVTSNVVNGAILGGLVGWQSDGSIVNSYATGSVAGGSKVGGLVGLQSGGSIAASYATGSVTGSSLLGGLVGSQSAGSIASSFWDKDNTGQAAMCGATTGGSGCNDSQFVLSSSGATAFASGSYGGFDFANAWFIVPGMSRPLLRAVGAVKDANGVYHIGNLYQLQSMAADLTGRYVLDKNIDAAATADSVAAGNLAVPNRSDVWGGAGFAPVGMAAVSFKGSLDGQGYAINNLNINRPTQDYIGLFGYADGMTIVNTGLDGGSVAGRNFVGALLGNQQGGVIAVTNAWANLAVTGSSYIGGLIGSFNSGSVKSSYGTGNVFGAGSNIGGLIGRSNFNNSTVIDSYAAGEVANTLAAGSAVGGLIGSGNATITNSHASGKVTNAGQNTGGLVGTSHGSIDNSYASGQVTGAGNYTGGLAGYADIGTISNSHASGTVSGKAITGGLVGQGAVLISGSYASGAVSGTTSVGGLVGANSAAISQSHADGEVTGAGNNVGGLVGYNTVASATVSDSYATGTVTNNSSSNTGGLVGTSYGAIGNSHASGQVTSLGSTVGGLVGLDYAAISNSHASGAVSGAVNVGGLVGNAINSGATVSRSYAQGGVAGTTYVGGLVGNSAASVSESFATGAVNGANQVGGLVGQSSAAVSQSYATGDVVGLFDVGGLLGAGKNVDHAYATGRVTGNTNVGGLVGKNDGIVGSDNYWRQDLNANGVGAVPAGSFAAVGRNAAAMMQAANFVGWSIDSLGGDARIWRIYEGHTTPLLKTFLTPLTVSLSGGSIVKTYNGAVQGINTSDIALPVGADADKVIGTFSPANGGRNAGSYAVTGIEGLYSTQLGYDLVGSGSTTLVIDPAPLMLSAVSDGKIYDGKTDSGGVATAQSGSTVFAAGTLLGSDTLSGLTQSFASKNVLGANGSTLKVNDGYTLNDGNGGNNYAVTTQSATGTISPANLSISADNVSKVYGQTPVLNAFSSSGLANGETIGGVTLASAGTSANASVTGGPYAIVPSNAAGGTFDPGNYAIAYHNGQLSVGQAALSVKANDAGKTYDGQAYSGGNGVVYTGFVNEESAGVLGGSLAYGGSAQGARNAGMYAIVPAGLSSGNYAIAFQAGVLTIIAASHPPSPSPVNTNLGADAIADLQMSTLARRSLLAPWSGERYERRESEVRLRQATIEVVDGGMRLPEGLSSE